LNLPTRRLCLAARTLRLAAQALCLAAQALCLAGTRNSCRVEHAGEPLDWVKYSPKRPSPAGPG